jgi:hypothetical protein
MAHLIPQSALMTHRRSLSLDFIPRRLGSFETCPTEFVDIAVLTPNIRLFEGCVHVTAQFDAVQVTFSRLTSPLVHSLAVILDSMGDDLTWLIVAFRHTPHTPFVCFLTPLSHLLFVHALALHISHLALEAVPWLWPQSGRHAYIRGHGLTGHSPIQSVDLGLPTSVVMDHHLLMLVGRSLYELRGSVRASERPRKFINRFERTVCARHELWVLIR